MLGQLNWVVSSEESVGVVFRPHPAPVAGGALAIGSASMFMREPRGRRWRGVSSGSADTGAFGSFGATGALVGQCVGASLVASRLKSWAKSRRWGSSLIRVKLIPLERTVSRSARNSDAVRKSGDSIGTVRNTGRPLRKVAAVESGEEVCSLLGHCKTIQSLAISPDSKRLLSGSSDRTARLWDIGTSKLVEKYEFGNEVGGVCFSPSGGRAATASVDGTVRVWRLPPR